MNPRIPATVDCPDPATCQDLAQGMTGTVELMALGAVAVAVGVVAARQISEFAFEYKLLRDGLFYGSLAVWFYTVIITFPLVEAMIWYFSLAYFLLGVKTFVEYRIEYGSRAHLLMVLFWPYQLIEEIASVFRVLYYPPVNRGDDE